MREAMAARRGRRRRLRRGPDRQPRSRSACAALLGKEAALFVPSGTMANQIALGVLTRPGDEIVCDAGAHCISFESGALAALWGVQARTVAGERGLLDPAAVEAAIRPVPRRLPAHAAWSRSRTPTTAAAARSTRCERVRAHRGGRAPARAPPLHGRRPPLERRAPRPASPPADYAAPRDTRLGLPLEGARRAGGLARVRADATSSRRRGGCASGSAAACARPGILAAAGLYALDHHVARLAEDHEQRAAARGRARRAPRRVAPLPGRDEPRLRRLRGPERRRPLAAARAARASSRTRRARARTCCASSRTSTSRAPTWTRRSAGVTRALAG